ncbi:type II secretion system protein GspL [Psychromonas ossibalaenae]|uniref:type II secretion system protein GspL n=1 Tax=Psychromonas ossibalaenae TaxID=444922 RepID=UPI000374667A|nr:type II secretion system protein GspL [Psychromonas ossibalaenae]
MTERLIIRLASEASQKNHWLIWSDDENEIIASGEVDNAEQLDLLTDKALQRSVVCLLPGVDVCIKPVAINGVFTRQMQQGLPYLVEEELASDVEKLHFTVLAKEKDLIHIAVCEQSKMINWLSWLENAQIKAEQFIPEGLALPFSDNGSWQAVQLDKQWLIRESSLIAWSCDELMLESILQSKLTDLPSQVIESHSTAVEKHSGEWLNAEPVLPMALLSDGVKGNKFNLLNGEFKVQSESNKNFDKWRVPGVVVAVLMLVFMLNIYVKNEQVLKKTELAKQRTELVYSKAFPAESKLRYARIKKKLNTMLKNLDSGEADSGFLPMLNELAPAFDNNSELQPQSIKFDSRKQEIQILASGKNFPAFEKFSASLPQEYTVQQGALTNNKNRVSGMLTIRKK